MALALALAVAFVFAFFLFGPAGSKPASFRFWFSLYSKHRCRIFLSLIAFPTSGNSFLSSASRSSKTTSTSASSKADVQLASDVKDL